nr:DC1, C1-like, zinc finger, RING/FYVE/PHD-type [Tanacetum cinerariifolium]
MGLHTAVTYVDTTLMFIVELHLMPLSMKHIHHVSWGVIVTRTHSWDDIHAMHVVTSLSMVSHKCSQSIHSACAPLILQSEQALHEDCVYKFVNMKFGGVINTEDHVHPLSFVAGTISDGDCTKCGLNYNPTSSSSVYNVSLLSIAIVSLLLQNLQSKNL